MLGNTFAKKRIGEIMDDYRSKNIENKQKDSVFNHTHIVLCRETYNPLGIIRSLGEAGVRPVAIVLPGSRRYVGSSKYISKVINAIDIEEAVEILFNNYGNMAYKPFLYITDDFFLEYIDRVG